MIKVYGKPIRVNKASQDKKTMDVGANLFIGNIDPDVDEKVLPKFFPPIPNVSLHKPRLKLWPKPFRGPSAMFPSAFARSASSMQRLRGSQRRSERVTTEGCEGFCSRASVRNSSFESVITREGPSDGVGLERLSTTEMPFSENSSDA
jgi:RNA recognition motif-containing protein